jgi:hypothetical protein
MNDPRAFRLGGREGCSHLPEEPRYVSSTVPTAAEDLVEGTVAVSLQFGFRLAAYSTHANK